MSRGPAASDRRRLAVTVGTLANGPPFKVASELEIIGCGEEGTLPTCLEFGKVARKSVRPQPETRFIQETGFLDEYDYWWLRTTSRPWPSSAPPSHPCRRDTK